MDVQGLLDNVRDLTDLELAVLLSLVAQQNCLITTEENLIDDLSSELALIGSEVFKLSYAVVSHEDVLSVEKFGEVILDQNTTPTESELPDHLQSRSQLASVDFRAASIAPSHASRHELDIRSVANIVVAKNFNYASREVQVAALELITRRRIYSRTTVHQVPKTFVFIPIISTSTIHRRLNDHLNDRISMSHYHQPEDGFANLEEIDDLFNNSAHRQDGDSDKQSTFSYSASQRSLHPASSREIHPDVIEKLRELGKSASMTPEVRRHIQDIIVFLRFARGVDRGVTPFATTQFVNLARYLAPLHGIEFVTPSLVALAARKVYAHRLVIASPERERSMQWGSDQQAVKEFLHDLNPEAVIEDVLATVPSPL